MQIQLAPQMELWDSLANCPFWDCWWMYIFARLAKHDSQGETLPFLSPSASSFTGGRESAVRVMLQHSSHETFSFPNTVFPSFRNPDPECRPS